MLINKTVKFLINFASTFSELVFVYRMAIGELNKSSFNCSSYLPKPLWCPNWYIIHDESCCSWLQGREFRIAMCCNIREAPLNMLPPNAYNEEHFSFLQYICNKQLPLKDGYWSWLVTMINIDPISTKIMLSYLVVVSTISSYFIILCLRCCN